MVSVYLYYLVASRRHHLQAVAINWYIAGHYMVVLCHAMNTSVTTKFEIYILQSLVEV